MHRRVAISFAEEIEKLSAITVANLDRNVIPALETRLKSAGMAASERAAVLSSIRHNSLSALSAAGAPGSATYAAAQKSIQEMLGGISSFAPTVKTPIGATVKWVDGKPVTVQRFSSSPVKLQPLKTNILGRTVLNPTGMSYVGADDLMKIVGAKGPRADPAAFQAKGERILRERARLGTRADLGSALRAFGQEASGAPMRAVRAAEGAGAGGTAKAINFITSLLRKLPR